ncbi:hypothetical protein BHE74_00059784 [Ensete ventricosum]|nr:hypothetical protein BHE74_00059784 [Ensete ventricosum]
MRKIDFKLRVMRLNRIKSFNTYSVKDFHCAYDVPPTASRGGGVGRRDGRPLVGRLPTAKGSHRLRRSSSDGGVVRVKEG